MRYILYGSLIISALPFPAFADDDVLSRFNREYDYCYITIINAHAMARLSNYNGKLKVIPPRSVAIENSLKDADATCKNRPIGTQLEPGTIQRLARAFWDRASKK